MTTDPLTADPLAGGPAARLDRYLLEAPVIAILRGIRSSEVPAVSDALVEAGVRVIEVPLNSPDPLDALRVLQRRHGDTVLTGAGTVLDAAEVRPLADLGVGLVVSPHLDLTLVSAVLRLGLACVPGVASPSEAMAAYHAGARWLKVFPMEVVGAAGLRAMRTILPSAIRLVPVGGVDAGSAGDLVRAGSGAVGAAGSLYRPGDDPPLVGDRAKALLAVVRAARTDEA